MKFLTRFLFYVLATPFVIGMLLVGLLGWAVFCAWDLFVTIHDWAFEVSERDRQSYGNG